jgi:SPW repeat
MKPWTRWQDWTNIGLGAWLFFSPWILGYAGPIAHNAWLLGALTALCALWALAKPDYRIVEGMNVGLGLWVFFAPAALRSGSVVAVWNAWLTGAVIAILALWVLSGMSSQVTRRHA